MIPYTNPDIAQSTSYTYPELHRVGLEPLDRVMNAHLHGSNGKLEYNFDDLEEAIFKIKNTECPTNAMLAELKGELNRFFKDSECHEVVYTVNTDKMFFGMVIYPSFNAGKNNRVINNIIKDEDTERIQVYSVELDSKLFDPALGLSVKQIMALLIYDISALVNDRSPIDIVRKNIDVYLTKNGEIIKLTDSVNYGAILVYGVKDALHKITSIFEKSDEELVITPFIVACGLGSQLESAFELIKKNNYNYNKDIAGNDMIVLAWAIRLYSAIRLRRIIALKTLKKGLSIVPSALERREMENVMRCLNRIDDETIMEGFFDFVSFKYSSIRSYEDDLYDYSLRVKNVNKEDDALVILHAINTRMSIIDDYLHSEKVPASEYKRWSTLLAKYQKLREVLASKNTYGSDYSRIYVSYPDAVNR